MSTAPRYLPRYTAADHAAWEGDWELVDGVAVAKTPSPFGPHAEKLSRLAAILWNAIDAAGCHATVLAELDWIVAADTRRPEPAIPARGRGLRQDLRDHAGAGLRQVREPLAGPHEGIRQLEVIEAEQVK